MPFDKFNDCFPFNIRELPLWDGSTYGPWVPYFGSLEISRPSASPTEQISVCGYGTEYGINLTLTEIATLYWLSKSFNVNILSAVISVNEIIQKNVGKTKRYRNWTYNRFYNNTSGWYENTEFGVPINTGIKLVCPSSDYSYFNLTFNKEHTEYTSSDPESHYPYINYFAYYLWHFIFNFDDVVVDPNGQYWMNFTFYMGALARISNSDSDENILNIINVNNEFTSVAEHTDDIRGINVDYTISKYKVRGPTVGGSYRTAETILTPIQFIPFGKTIAIYKFPSNWPNHGMYPNPQSTIISININDYFNYSNKSLSYIKDYYWL
jgi:hypothetical protein